MLIVVFALAAAQPAEGAIVFVNDNATGAGDGSKWVDAYASLQTALAASDPGDEVWVAAGTYTPGPPGDAISSFTLKSGVQLYGGFVGTESDRNHRNWSTNPTVLSGDVGHDDVYGTPWYVGWNITTANSGHVVDASGVDASAVIDGFHITAGHTGPFGTPAGDPLMYGSGIYIISGSPTIRHCTFSRNLAAFAAGGAIYCADSAPEISECLFTQNWVHLGNGAGIAVVGNGAPTIRDCEFTENHAICEGGNTGQGAAIGINFLTAPLAITIERCRFEYNVARTFYPAGGIEIARGGGISNFGATLTVRDCTFLNNSANSGAGIQTWDPATIINCVFLNNQVYSHDFGAGSDGGYGAGVCAYSFQPDVATLVNCTVANNTGAEGVGLQSWASASFNVRNTIIWGNVATGGDVAPLDAQIKGTFSAEYSCIKDLLTPIPGEDPPDPENFPGCIVVNPMFANAGAGDVQLSPGSPCIDAGRNSDVPVDVVIDLAGFPRFFDDPDITDTGVGIPPVVDMGAFEQVPVAAGDVNCDGVIGFPDVQFMTEVLLELDTSPCHIKAADMNLDLTANGSDIPMFVEAVIAP